ncbi:MAG TPA: FAD-dependent oxidoreductase, partial [Actinospica sp.]|nr:FAD-dependent oxidoreductase [Actinospica sp.]
MNHPTPIDVLVVGAGPAGTALAIDLARRGLAVRTVNKAPGAFDGSRAKGIQPRTLEVLADLGALDDVHEGGDLYPKLALHVGPVGVPWRMMPEKEPTPDVPYPNTWLIPQYRTDRALHARLSELGVGVEFGRELVELSQDDEYVTARIADHRGTEEITARYLVGADGGSSAVRKQLGIEFTGTTDEAERLYIVDATTTGLSRDRWHMWPLPRARFMGACPLPHSDVFQWMLRLGADETPPAGAAELTERIRAHTHSSKISLHLIHWTSVFRPNIRLAERYRSGRALIVGDAAHVHPPAGAQGLNTGIQDSYNLGWKIAQVLAGADPVLLDTYEAERQPIAAGVLGLATEKFSGMAKLDPSSIKRGKDEQQLALSYFGGPLASPEAERTSTLRVGDRSPDADLRGPDGPVKLFEALRGEHFTAIAHGTHAAEDLARLPWSPAGAPLRRVTIDASGPSPDLALTDPDGTFERIYGIAGDTLLLIRP